MTRDIRNIMQVLSHALPTTLSGFFVWIAIVAMMHNGIVTLDFNHFGEGWLEVIIMTLITIGGSYYTIKYILRIRKES